MPLSELHVLVLKTALANILGEGANGTIVFIRCLSNEILYPLIQNEKFTINDWDIRLVSDYEDVSDRIIPADKAVEIRETKEKPTLLLVDIDKAGAGMDGIYGAGREVKESELFKEALKLAAAEITKSLSGEERKFAEKAVRKSRRRGRKQSVSPWLVFDYYINIALHSKHPRLFLYILGLWPMKESIDVDPAEALDISQQFVDRLLSPAVAGQTPNARIENLRLLDPSEHQIKKLETFLRRAAHKPIQTSLEDLKDEEELWVNVLKLQGPTQFISGIEMVPWRVKSGKVAKWSGLINEGDQDDPPVLIIDPDAENNSNYSKLEVHWKAVPTELEKGCAEYRIEIVTDMDEEIASGECVHSAKKDEKYRFTNDDFALDTEDALIPAKIVISVIGDDTIEKQETEEFIIRYGVPEESSKGGIGKKVRTFSEGLIELNDREAVTTIADLNEAIPEDSKGYIVLRTPSKHKSFKVYRPPLIKEIEKLWCESEGLIGRWVIKVRTSGARAGIPEFIHFDKPDSFDEGIWSRLENESRRLASKFTALGGGTGQIYDEKSKTFDNYVKEYILAWAAALESGNPTLPLANTIEVQSLSGRTYGLIVLPSHPLRIAWHVAYDNLVLHSRFNQELKVKEVIDTLKFLDGAMFPAYLPGLEKNTTFVFADNLGFHTVGMVLDSDKEPKAAIAILARALGDPDSAESAPTVGRQSAQILGDEIIKYLQCHNISRLLHIHALRPGDGFTVARSLGQVNKYFSNMLSQEDLDDEDQLINSPGFVLELYPSESQKGITGKFIANVRERRRSGAGTLSSDDTWMLDSIPLPGGTNLPKLRWARKVDDDIPNHPAHLAVAFDTFESKVVPSSFNDNIDVKRPLYGFGLLSFFERSYHGEPSPIWESFVPSSEEGEKHPSDRHHSERLLRIQNGIFSSVLNKLGNNDAAIPILKTEITPEKADSLKSIHKLCDWVITVDRNAGIEYFDSPKCNKDIYDAYVIDCVPEREDLGCLQLITSTSNLDEVRIILDKALDQMGLSRSRRNAEFLLENLKALSGRLAIRLTGQRSPASELIALSLSYANCRNFSGRSEAWLSLNDGFFIPVDDIQDILPIVGKDDRDEEEQNTRPDLIHVSINNRKTLQFSFVEVKYRRHLREARNPSELKRIEKQITPFKERWDDWFSNDHVASIRALRRAKLARVLRFYAEKACRHYLGKEAYSRLVAEIDKMISNGASYSFAQPKSGDRGYVFCPDYSGSTPLKISPDAWNAKIFLFGPDLMPVSQIRDEVYIPADLGDTKVDLGEIETQEHAESRNEVPSKVNEVAQTTNVVVKSHNMEPSVIFGTDLLSGSEVEWRITVKGNPHLMIVGLPGMGKTTCLLNLCKQLLEQRISPIIFSYHQDIDERLVSDVGDVRFIDFDGLGFNPLHVLDRTSKFGYLDVAGALRDIFTAIFPELGDIQAEHIRKSIKDSFMEKGWGTSDLSSEKLEEPEFMRFFEILKDNPKPDRGLKTLINRLEELADYGFFDVRETRASLWESDIPTIIRIHTSQNDNLQRAFASLVFYSMYKDMFRRGISMNLTHAVIFDETHRASGLKLIPTMAKECRKYGISLILASQEARDFDISLFSAIANYLVLRLTDTDAKALVRNVASSDQERGLIDKIKQMDRFKALYFSEGKKRPSYLALRP